MPARIHDCTGVLLAGGRAERLGGIPKGLLVLDGQQVAARTLQLFAALFGASLIAATDSTPYRGLGVPTVPDLLPGKGAPGGLHAALRAAHTGWIFAAACDMPFLAAGPILLLEGRRAGVAAVLPRHGGRLHPLHGLWSRACLPVLEQLLTRGDPSLAEIAKAVGACLVGEEEWRTVDPLGRALENVNTPEDVARLGLSFPAPSPAGPP